MKRYRRIDRFLEAAIGDFAEWIRNSSWLGKERDCVNVFATRFVRPAVSSTSAITDYSQVRIECGVPQPKHPDYDRPSAAKDLVIWHGPLDVAWDSNWKPVRIPWVVIEWKTRRRGHSHAMFDKHDERWLKAFSEQNPASLGYAVTVDLSRGRRQVHYARFSRGEMTVRLNVSEE
jgi:hypothetical protein